MGKNNEDHLKGKILFFSPNDEGASYFTDSLIYMCDHNSNGSLGLIVNRPLNLKLDDLFKGLKIRETKNNSKSAFLGGPVNPGAIFILHSSEKSWKGTLEVTHNISMTTDLEAIEDIAQGSCPEEYMITLGYTGWGPDQLNDELSDNAWMTFPENVDLIFKIEPEKQVDEMSKILGYDIRMINPGFGNA